MGLVFIAGTASIALGETFAPRSGSTPESPLFSPQFLIDGPVIHPGNGTQFGLSPADGGFLAVVVGGNYPVQVGPIYVVLFDLDGGVQNPGGTVVAQGGGAAPPAAAWDGTNWLLSWEDGSGAALGLRIGPDLNPVGSSPFTIGDSVDSNWTDYGEIHLAFNGAEYIAVWPNDTSSGLGVAATLVGVDGGVVLPDIIVTPSGYEPAVASDGTDFLVAWEHRAPMSSQFEVMASRMSGTGTVLDPGGIPIAAGGPSTQISVVWDGLDYVVVWDTFSAPCQTMAARIAPDGTLVDSTPIDVSPGQYPSAAWDGSTVRIFSEDLGYPLQGPLYATSLAPNGTVTEQATQIYDVVYGANTFAAGVRGGAFVGVEDQSADFGFPLVPGNLNTHGVIIDPLVNSEITPAATASGEQMLLAWADTRIDGPGSWGVANIHALISPLSGPPSSTAFPLTPVDFTQYRPSAASDRASFLVAYTPAGFGSGQPQAAYEIVLPDGGIPTWPGKTLGGGWAGNVSYGCGQYLLSWESRSNGVSASRLGTDGQALDSSAIGLSSAMAIPVGSFDGREFLDVWIASPTRIGGSVVWCDGGHSSSSDFVIDGAWPQEDGGYGDGGLSDDGGTSVALPGGADGGSNSDGGSLDGGTTSQDAGGLDAGPFPCVPVRDPTNVTVVSSGQESLVAWINGAASGSVCGAFVEMDAGAVVTGWPFSIAPFALASDLSASFDGSSYILVWEAKLGGTSQIQGQRLQANGALVDASPFVAASSLVDLLTPSLVSNGAGHTVIVWSQYHPEWNNYRLTGEFANESGCKTELDCTVSAPCVAAACNEYSSTCELRAMPDGTACAGGICANAECLAVDAGTPSSSSGSGGAGANGSTGAGSTGTGASGTPGGPDDAGVARRSSPPASCGGCGEQGSGIDGVLMILLLLSGSLLRSRRT